MSKLFLWQKLFPQIHFISVKALFHKKIFWEVQFMFGIVECVETRKGWKHKKLSTMKRCWKRKTRIKGYAYSFVCWSLVTKAIACIVIPFLRVQYKPASCLRVVLAMVEQPWLEHLPLLQFLMHSLLSGDRAAISLDDLNLPDSIVECFWYIFLGC